MRRGWGLFFVLCLCGNADDNHYKSVLIGERAIGLGGSYVALSEDPSAVYYNPAGLTLARPGQFNATANAFQATEYRFRNIAPGQDYVMRSSGLIPSYFGFTDRFLKFETAFLIAVPQSDQIDQSDDIKNFSTKADEVNEVSRKYAQKNNIYHVGGAVAVPLGDQFSAGLGVVAVVHQSSFINFQYSTYNPLPAGKYTFRGVNANTTSYGLLTKGGVMYRPTKDWSAGLSLSYLRVLGGEGTGKIVESNLDGQGIPKVPTGSAADDVSVTEINNLFYKDPEILKGALGVAYRITDDMLVSGQLDYYGTDPNYAPFTMKTTFNLSAGIEYFVDPQVPLRFGLFTDNANTPKLVEGVTDQESHVDLVGGVLTASYMNEKSSTTLGLSYAVGTGQAQVLRSTLDRQVLHQKTFIVYFSGSYQL